MTNVAAPVQGWIQRGSEPSPDRRMPRGTPDKSKWYCIMAMLSSVLSRLHRRVNHYLSHHANIANIAACSLFMKAHPSVAIIL